jgi:uncharacterized protein YbaR (Trm112 family)
MKVALRLGMEKLAWSLRRLHCPVSKDALVLEVGSGGNPYARANVLLDAYEVTRERHWVPLVADRPTVLGMVENLPFKNKAFDFVIASHVLEHSADPEKFLSELQRVANAGYIEVPDAFMERINPYRDHRLEITQRGDGLVIRKKLAWANDEDLVELYENKVKPWMTRELMPRHPFSFHVRYYWQGEVRCIVLNPDADAGWNVPETAADTAAKVGLVSRFKGFVLSSLRNVMSQRDRNRRIDCLNLLRCPSCHGEQLKQGGNGLECPACGAAYAVNQGIPKLFAATTENNGVSRTL